MSLPIAPIPVPAVNTRYFPRLFAPLLHTHMSADGAAIHVLEEVMELLLIVLVLVLLFGGGGFYGYRRWR